MGFRGSRVQIPPSRLICKVLTAWRPRAATPLLRLGDETALSVTRAGRNDPCPCGSGRKYKKCHGEADALALKLARDAQTRPRILIPAGDPVAQMVRQNETLVRQQGRVRYLAAER